MSLERRTKIALDESRTLMLGASILAGFQFQGPFQPLFEHLSPFQKAMYLLALCILVLVLALLVGPGAYHRITERGEATVATNRVTTLYAQSTLLPFALAISLDLAIGGGLVAGDHLALVLFVASISMMLGFWYGGMLMKRRAKEPDPQEGKEQPTSTLDKIELVLTESRVILPGVQALLGFQLAILLTQGFGELSQTAKYLHGAALCSVTLSMILLMAPAAYHRIVYDGQIVAEFYAIASRFVLVSTVFLAIGLSVEMYVVVQKIEIFDKIALPSAIGAFAALMLFWYVVPLAARHARSRPSAESRHLGGPE